MLKNYVRRSQNLIKQKVYTTINVLGLSVGVASCLLITLFVADELSYDNFHVKGDNLYKIALERKYPNHITNYAIIPHSYADVIQRDFPEVEATVKIAGPNPSIVNFTNELQEVKRFEEEFIMAADSNFFDIFSIKLLKGDPKKFFRKTLSVVTQHTAARYSMNCPIGKTIRILTRIYHHRSL